MLFAVARTRPEINPESAFLLATVASKRHSRAFPMRARKGNCGLQRDANIAQHATVLVNRPGQPIGEHHHANDVNGEPD